jgi:hypothetical protein
MHSEYLDIFTVTDYYGKEVHSYEFISSGKQRIIFKRLAFTPTQVPCIYNLSFGDITPGGVMDILAISDNGDTDLILEIIEYAIMSYMEKFPERWVFCWSFSKVRMRLFRRRIVQRFEELSPHVHIYGEIQGKMYPFRENLPLESILFKKRTTDLIQVPDAPKHIMGKGVIWVRGRWVGV